MRFAFEEMIHGPEDDHGIAAPEASMLLGQLVKSKYKFMCKVGERYLR